MVRIPSWLVQLSREREGRRENKARRTKFTRALGHDGILQTDTDEKHLHGRDAAQVLNERISGEGQGCWKDGEEGEETHGGRY